MFKDITTFSIRRERKAKVDYMGRNQAFTARIEYQNWWVDWLYIMYILSVHYHKMRNSYGISN